MWKNFRSVRRIALGTFVDILLLAVLAGFAISGFRKGFVRSLVGFVGSIAAVAVTAYHSQKLAADLLPWLEKTNIKELQNPFVAKLIAAVLLFAVLEALVQVIAHALGTVFRLPVLRQINALLGGVLGLLKGGVVVLLVCAALRLILLPAGLWQSTPQVWREISHSRIYQYAAGRNPVYTLFQTHLWNEVGKL
jgi:membrane protein required for colicin V production